MTTTASQLPSGSREGGKTFVCHFVVGRRGGVATTVEGRTAFPTRAGIQPPRDTWWTVSISGESHDGKVLFVNCLEQFTPTFHRVQQHQQKGKPPLTTRRISPILLDDGSEAVEEQDYVAAQAPRDPRRRGRIGGGLIFLPYSSPAFFVVEQDGRNARGKRHFIVGINVEKELQEEGQDPLEMKKVRQAVEIPWCGAWEDTAIMPGRPSLVPRAVYFRLMSLVVPRDVVSRWEQYIDLTYCSLGDGRRRQQRCIQGPVILPNGAPARNGNGNSYDYCLWEQKRTASGDWYPHTRGVFAREEVWFLSVGSDVQPRVVGVNAGGEAGKGKIVSFAFTGAEGEIPGVPAPVYAAMLRNYSTGQGAGAEDTHADRHRDTRTHQPEMEGRTHSRDRRQGQIRATTDSGIPLSRGDFHREETGGGKSAGDTEKSGTVGSSGGRRVSHRITDTYGSRLLPPLLLSDGTPAQQGVHFQFTTEGDVQTLSTPAVWLLVRRFTSQRRFQHEIVGLNVPTGDINVRWCGPWNELEQGQDPSCPEKVPEAVYQTWLRVTAKERAAAHLA